MLRKILFFTLVLISPLCVAGEGINIVYDANPEAGIPHDAKLITPHDGKDYGAMKSVVNPSEILFIKVRYYNDSFKNLKEVETYLIAKLHSDTSSTVDYIPWAEGLPVPSIEATIYFKSLEKSKWLVWKNRSVFQDKQMKWWFGYDF